MQVRKTEKNITPNPEQEKLLLMLLQLIAKRQLQQPTPNAKDDKDDNDDGIFRAHPSSLNPKCKTRRL